MTREEHALVLALFVKQEQFIKTIFDILKSRGIVSGDDLAAFEFSAVSDASSNLALFQEARAKYIQLAKGLGIETGLEKIGPISESDFQR